MSFSSLHSESDEDFERHGFQKQQPQAGLILQQFNDAWINNNWKVEENWFDDNFQFVTPLFTVSSFTDFSAWFEQMLSYVSHAEISQQYTSDHCTCCIVDVTIGNQAGILRLVELVTFENNKITEIEWIYDPREVESFFTH